MNTEHRPKVPGSVITFIIRDEAPFIHLQEPPTHRSVQIELTPEQQHAIALRCTGQIGRSPIYESVGKCFLEPDSRPAGGKDEP